MYQERERRLTSGASCTGSSVLVARRAGVVLRADTEDDVLELQTVWSWESALGHQLGESVEVFGRSVRLRLLCGQSID